MDTNNNTCSAMACHIMVLIVFLLTGCGEDPNRVATDRSLNGTLNVPIFSVAPGATVKVPGDLTINADSDIFIEGNIRAANDNPNDHANRNGASITLRSHGGDIHIPGEIESGDGADGEDQTGRATVTGLPGLNGGNITLVATRGAIIVSGSVVAGGGGDGGSATASGANQLVYAESGAGGAGGEVSVVAAKRIEVSNVTTGSASIEAGSGGDSGSADAEVQRGDTIDPVNEETSPDNGANNAGNEEGELPEPELPETAPAVIATTAQARALRGGDGGKITLQVTHADGEILLQGDIEAGDGGNTGSAMASGAEAAKAESATAAKGANVDVVITDLTKLLSFTFPEAGDGGSNGVTAGPVQAFAIGTVSALAEVKGGGAPGHVTEQGANVSTGTGGSTGHARADIPGISNLTPGHTHFDVTPAPAIQAHAP